MTRHAGANFTVVFKQLDVLRASGEFEEVETIRDEAEEIEELRRVIEETNAPSCIEFATT